MKTEATCRGTEWCGRVGSVSGLLGEGDAPEIQIVFLGVHEAELHHLCRQVNDLSQTDRIQA